MSVADQSHDPVELRQLGCRRRSPNCAHRWLAWGWEKLPASLAAENGRALGVVVGAFRMVSL